MNKIEKFLSFIDEKTEGKFTFLKLKNLSFNKTTNALKTEFIYPAQEQLADADRKEIVQAIKEYLQKAKAEVSLKVEINKSFVESDLVFGKVKDFLAQNYKAIFSAFDFKNLTVLCEEKVKVYFKLEKNLSERFEEQKIEKKLLEHLEKNFCAQFEISFSQTEEESFDEDLLTKRIAEIREKSDFDALLSASQEKYFLLDKKPFIGTDITFNPRFIKTISRPMDTCVVAGKLSNLTEKSFKKKSKKTDENGEAIFEEKPYFKFQLRDDTGAINGVIFPTKAAYHKMHLLKEGNILAVQGRVTKFNEAFEINAEKISFCTLPSREENLKNVVNIVDGYRFVRPRKYSVQQQTSLFKEKEPSKEILKNTFVVYDFETTGIDSANEEIIEIGALKIENGQFTEEFSTLVKPTKRIPPDATRVNKITDEMVADSLPIERVLGDFFQFCKGAQLVGYNNISFDKAFLDKAGAKVGINFEHSQIDVLLLARQKLNGLKHYNLGSVAKNLNVELTDAHRALSDVIATAEIFLKLY